MQFDLSVRTMRFPIMLIAGLLTGCVAAHPRPAPPVTGAAPAEEAVASSALVFAPPVQSPYPLEGLARGTRQPWAFAGYDEQVSETYVVVSDDEQGNGCWDDGYQRSAVAVKVGTRSR